MENDHDKQIPIWYFIGIILAVYGLMILGSGIYGAVSPPPEEARVKLWHLHADIWWGTMLLIVGIFYVVKFPPSKKAPSIK